MSKRGQYVRHTWTHRTQSQKLPDYGKINLDECSISCAKTIVSDSDDELSDSERMSKRRRIEKLAQDYLKGEPLFISSVRPCPQALERAIVWQKKSSDEPGFVLPQVGTSTESNQAWEEAENDDEILERLTRSVQLRGNARKAETSISDPIEPVEDVQAQASCKPQRRQRNLNVNSGPSEEALRQAAALRNRKTRPGITQPPVIGGPVATMTPLADPSDCINVTQSERVLRSRRNKREWLSRRKSRFSFGDDVASRGSDTASSPCVGASSPPSQSLRRQAASSPANRLDRDSIANDYPGSSLQEVQADPSAVRLRRPAEPVEACSNHEPETKEHASEVLAEEDQEDHVAAQVDDKSSLSEQATVEHARSAPISSSSAVQQHKKPSYLQAPSTQNGTTPLMYRKRRERSNPANEQNSAAGPTTMMTRRSNRQRVTFPSSEDPQTGEAQAEQNVASHPPVLDMSFQHDESFAPRLNMALVEEHMNKVLPEGPCSTDKSSSVKRALRRQLRHSGAEMTRVDSEPPPPSQFEHVQSPAEDRAAAPASSPRSQQPEQPKRSTFERRQTWLGTQAMVARAERELIISPEKERSTFMPINEQKRASQQRLRVEEQTPFSQEREPLVQLSQEPAPSTQAMLDAFGGFSTVKKPRPAAILKSAVEMTPVTAPKGKQIEPRPVPEPQRSSLQRSSTPGKARDSRGSSLRFSISSFKPSMPDHDQKEPHNESPQAEAPQNMSNTTFFATPALLSSSTRKSALKSSYPRSSQGRQSHRRSSQTHEMFSQSISLSTDPPTMSFRPAQGPEAPVGLLRDPSDLSQTIEDLTRDVLGTSKEMIGMWSQ